MGNESSQKWYDKCRKRSTVSQVRSTVMPYKKSEIPNRRSLFHNASWHVFSDCRNALPGSKLSAKIMFPLLVQNKPLKRHTVKESLRSSDKRKNFAFNFDLYNTMRRSPPLHHTTPPHHTTPLHYTTLTITNTWTYAPVQWVQHRLVPMLLRILYNGTVLLTR